MMPPEDMQRTLGRIEAKVDSLLLGVADNKAYIRDVSDRVGALERFRASVRGWAAAVGALAGFASAIVKDWITRGVH